MCATSCCSGVFRSLQVHCARCRIVVYALLVASSEASFSCSCPSASQPYLLSYATTVRSIKCSSMRKERRTMRLHLLTLPSYYG
ncbi:hypothetical protein BKA63DRAFT_527421 [Paraphoma chrysanthemicola]|nr:hypothetical protein BKA63DRAFT_527421 [Paraphoma chrysanthemicola]